MKRLLLIIAALVVLTASASAAGGSCSAFVAGVCSASVPTGVTSFYFIDYVGGSDANAGNSEAAAWQHMPSCANVTGGSVAALHTPTTGEGWIFKGGVTVDFHCWPANLPWGGASSTPDYVGPDLGWFTGGSWARPIFSGGGSTGYNSNSGTMLGDATHNASWITIDNIEFTGLWWSGTNCQTSAAFCNYVAWHVAGFNVGGSTADGWEIKNIYAHNITHGTWPASNDPSNTSAIFWIPRAPNSSFHNNKVVNTDGSADCCWAIYAGNIYQNYFDGFDNIVFNASSSNNDNGTFFTFHDNTINAMVTTFYPNVSGAAWQATHVYALQTGITPVNNNTGSKGFQVITAGTSGGTEPVWNSLCSTSGATCTDGTVVWENMGPAGAEPHGNCIHVFGTLTSAFKQLIYNNRVNCMDSSGQPTHGNAESVLTEEDGSVVYIFNEVDTNEYQGNGYNIGNFSGGAQGGTINIFDSTAECGLDPSSPNGTANDPGHLCFNVKGATSTTAIVANNNVGFSSNFQGGASVSLPGSWAGTFTSAPRVSKTCGGVPDTIFGGTMFCAPTATLNISEAAPFGPQNSTDSALIGTSTAQSAFCTTISGINAAAGTACLSDTTLGVTLGANNTIVWPARTPIVRPTGGSPWEMGAYEFQAGNPTAATPTFSPVAGTYNSAQSVTISSTSSGAIICYNTTGSPATNGTTGCTTGTLYSSAVSVPSSETLFAVAGGTGFVDSAVGSAVYVIVPVGSISTGNTITTSGFVRH